MGKFIIIATLAAMCLGLVSPFLQLSSKTHTKPENEKSQVINHAVKKGETLTEIAEIYYKNPEYWTNLWNDNPDILNPSIIEIGTKVIVKKNAQERIEDIDNELMARLLKSPQQSKIDPNLAFVGAGITETEIKPTSETVAINASSIVSAPQKAQISQATTYDEVYKQAGEKYGVPWQVLYGLHLTETGLRDGAIYKGQGSGAQGPMQFMPGTWSVYGVDGNGDGYSDINNAVDAIHGAANYLAKHGGVMPGLRYYGGNTSGTLQAACEKGYCL